MGRMTSTSCFSSGVLSTIGRIFSLGEKPPWRYFWEAVKALRRLHTTIRHVMMPTQNESENVTSCTYARADRRTLTQNQNTQDNEKCSQHPNRSGKDSRDWLSIFGRGDVAELDVASKVVGVLDVSPLKVAGMKRRDDNGH